MDLEFHQLDRRYEALRKRDPRKERQLLASLAEHGQLLPVVAAAERFIVIDGYKRLRALTRLAHDTVRALRWELEETEALILEQLMRAADPVGARAGVAVRRTPDPLRAVARRSRATV